jgi:hypothetical protein
MCAWDFGNLSLVGQFFSAGDRITKYFNDGSVSTLLGRSTSDPTGHASLFTRVPTNAQAGAASVVATGSRSGSGSAAFTVPQW